MNYYVEAKAFHHVAINAFTIPNEVKTDRYGLQSELNDEFYIYEWNPKIGRHERIKVSKKILRR